MVFNQSSVARNCSHTARNCVEITEPAFACKPDPLAFETLTYYHIRAQSEYTKVLSSGFLKNIQFLNG